MQPTTRILHQALSDFRTPVKDIDLSGLQAAFAALMDQCANAVTLQHGLDMDDVILERYALVVLNPPVGPNADVVGENLEVAIPFLADRDRLIAAIQTRHNVAPTVLEGLEIQHIGIRAILETASPLFNQAGNQPGRE